MTQAPLNDGAKALQLVLDQQSWTHRRVEVLTFLASGETQRRVSWDFTVPVDLAIKASAGRIVVPLTTLRKEPLKAFDLEDGNGRALPLWGTLDNGRLAFEMAIAGLEAVRGTVADTDLRDAVSRVVFAADEEAAAADIEVVATGCSVAGSTATEDERDVFLALLTTLAGSFLFLAELSEDVTGVRTLVKATYEDERSKQSAQVNFAGETSVDIDTSGWGWAASWHLEVHAPGGLRVAELLHETSDPVTHAETSLRIDDSGAATAHVAMSGVSPWDDSICRIRLVPDPSALLNPLTLGALLGAGLLWTAWAFVDEISMKLQAIGASGAPLAAVVFSLPALFFALSTRSDEHELVSKVLLGPRLASLGCALSLWGAGVVIVWAPSRDDLAAWLLGVAVVQSLCFAWLALIRVVGGRR